MTHTTPSAQYAVTVRLESPHEPSWMANIASIIAREGGAIGAVDLVHIHRSRRHRCTRCRHKPANAKDLANVLIAQCGHALRPARMSRIDAATIGRENRQLEVGPEELTGP